MITRTRLALVLVGLVATAAPVRAQGGPVTIRAVDPATGATVEKLGDATNNALRIRIVASDVSSSGGTSAADGATYAAGTTAGTPLMGARDDGSPGTVAEDKLGILRITTNRAAHVNLRDAAGTELGVAAAPVQVSLANTAANATAVKVDGSAVTQPVSGTVTASVSPTVTSTVLQSAATANGNGSVADYAGKSTVVYVLNCASCSGGTTVNFEGSPDNANFIGMLSTQLATNTVAFATQATGITQWQTSMIGQRYIRARISNYSAGTVTVTAYTSDARPTQIVTNTNVVNQPNVAALDGSLATLGATTDSRSTATDSTSITAMQVLKELSFMEQNPASRAVTNTGTFAVQIAATVTVAGGKTNNNAAPGATNIGALVALANTSAPSYSDGNEVLLSTDTSGGLRVNCVTGCGGGTGGTAMADKASFTFGTTQFTPTGGVFDNTPPSDLTTGQAGAFRLTPKRAVHVEIRNDSGTEMGTASNPFQVSLANTGSNGTNVNVNCASGCSGGTQYTQDAALTVATTVGTMAMGRASAAAPTDVSADNDAVIPWYLRSGALVSQPTYAGVLATTGNGTSGTGVQRVTIASDSTGQVTLSTGANTIGALTANQSVNVAQIAGTNTVTGGVAGLLAVAGAAASGASKSGNPVQVGGVFNTTQPTVTNGQAVEAQYTARGAAMVATGTDTFTVTANAGTNLNTSALALESGGNLATLAGTVTAARAAVNSISGQAGVAGNTGTVGATTQRVTLATDVALPTGANTIGAVTQASGPWTSNVTQFGTNNVVTGTGASGVGIPRVTVSSDSALASVTSITNTVTTQGAKTNNTAAPGATNLGTLPALANATAPSYTEGNQVALSTDLAGALRVSGASGGGVAQTQVRNAANSWADVGYYTTGNTNLTMPVTDSALVTLLQAMLVAQQKQGYIKGAFGNAITSTGSALNVALPYGDPCQSPSKGNIAISQAANARLLSGTGRRVYVCSIFVVGADAENVSLVEGSGATCATNTIGIIGAATAANGPNLAANGGFTYGSGAGTVAIGDGQDVCLYQSGSGRVAGNLTYVVQ